MEFLNEIWQAIAPYLAGVSLGGIASAVICGCIKGISNKALQKLNVEKITEAATEKGIDRIKKVSFSQTIQPIVESELKKITEQANAYIKEELNNVQAKYDNLIVILEKLSAYFNNSIGVSETSKEELHNAINSAKTTPNSVETVLVEEEVKEEEKTVVTTKKQPKTTNKIER